MSVFTEGLLLTIQNLIVQHHTVYPSLPPQGQFFEALVQRAFHLCVAPEVQVIASTPNAPSFDLMAAGQKFSIKTETGRGTDANLITITKLCTTEKEPWAAQVLIQRVLEHLSEYDHMLMLRAIWLSGWIHYQLLEIPLDLLRLVHTATVVPVGRREGRRSLAGDVSDGGQVLFRVHFDGADGKCQIRNLRVERCIPLR